MKRKSVFFIFGGLLAMFLLVGFLWFFVFTSTESRFFAGKLQEWRELIEPGAGKEAPVMESTLTFSRAQGLPKQLENKSASLSFRFPNTLYLEAEVEGNRYGLARKGEEILIQVPHKNLSIRGKNSVPRFSSRPDSVEPVELPSFRFPLSRMELWLLPALVAVEKTLTEEMEIVLRVKPRPFAARKFGIPGEGSLMLELESETGFPRSIEVRDGGKLDAEVRFSNWSIQRTEPDRGDWEKAEKTEEVALSHLAKFVETTLRYLNHRTEPLPPFQGGRQVVARSGEGRLEDWDGAKVLFLKGSPEVMGHQHGQLLRDEVREVADRILYSIGVGSSFDKGRWFFGEIEEAVSRFQPFVDPRYLREMDSLALASGLEKEEVRLTNFFPELFHCSGFAINGEATAGGEMYHGRILDYMLGVGLEQNAVVMVLQPDEGNAWVNVSYAGFIGSVTAMNEKHLAIGEMGGRGEGNWDGKPMAQLVREVMEKADSLEEAIAIMEAGPRTCEYYYVISDGKSGRAVGIVATPEKLETIWPGESHPQLPHPVKDAVLLSAGDRYEELVRRVKQNYGTFDAESAIGLMTRPVCAPSNIQSVLFAPGSLDFWVANADAENVASHARFTKYNLAELLKAETALTIVP